MRICQACAKAMAAAGSPSAARARAWSTCAPGSSGSSSSARSNQTRACSCSPSSSQSAPSAARKGASPMQPGRARSMRCNSSRRAMGVVGQGELGKALQGLTMAAGVGAVPSMGLPGSDRAASAATAGAEAPSSRHALSHGRRLLGTRKPWRRADVTRIAEPSMNLGAWRRVQPLWHGPAHRQTHHRPQQDEKGCRYFSRCGKSNAWSKRS